MPLIFAAACFLAYANGANDNFKGVASLFGSRTCSYRTAIAWATFTTFGGSLCAMLLAQTLLRKFSGRQFVPDQIVSSDSFLLAVAVGAGVTVIAASLTGFPVSTTHGLIGAMIGSGLMASGSQVNFQALGSGFLLPLLLSPVLAIVLTAPFYLLLRFSGVARQSRFVDSAHFLSAGIVGFARGLNDTPKIAAMLLLVKALDIRWGIVAVAVAMAVGGLLNARKVAETMSFKITSMNKVDGLAANLSTGVLVILASRYGLPVSTTHVSVGALFGIGLTTGKANLRVMSGVALSWVLTLPCAIVLGALAWWVAARL